MKIFEKTEGQEIAYLQYGDMGFINSIDIPIPADIMMEMARVRLISEHNRREYAKFTNPKTVQFIKEQDYILDLNDYINLSLSDAEQKYDEVSASMTKMIGRYNRCEDDLEREALDKEYYLKQHKLDAIVTVCDTIENEGCLDSLMPEDYGQSQI